MRDSLKETEQIEQYLLGKLNETERKKILKRIKEDRAFSQKVELQRSLMKRIEVISIKEKIQAAHKRNVNTTNANRWSHKGGLFFILIVVLVTIIAVVLLTEKEDKAMDKVVKQEKSFIQPPLNGVDVPFIYRSINPSKENVLVYESGSVLIIPPLAFADSNGQTILDTIQIQFREFSDAVDLYLSGIPMDYEIDGKEYPFESAAMCEIYALKDNQKVNLNKGKKIEVVQSTYTTSTAFNLYRFDQKIGSWEKKGKDIGVNMNAEDETRTKSDSIAQPVEEVALLDELTEEVEPVTLKPQRADPEKLKFSISYEKNEFPELLSFDNVLFEIDESASNFQQGDNDIEWEDVRIERGDALGSYRVIFTKASENIRREYAVRPVFEGENYSNAMALYNKKMQRYANVRTKREKVEKEEGQIQRAKHLAVERRNKYIDSMNAAIEQRNVIVKIRNSEIEQQNTVIIEENRKLLARMDSIYQVREERRKKNQRLNDFVRKNSEITNGLKRVYSIDQFGIWNSDCPTNLPKGAVLAADFRISDEPIKTVVLIDKGIRSLFNYYSYTYNQFQYNPMSENLVWAVVDQKVVYFNQFSNVPEEADSSYVFRMQELDIPTKDYQTIKSAIMKL